jgi:hypothetical protein
MALCAELESLHEGQHSCCALVPLEIAADVCCYCSGMAGSVLCVAGIVDGAQGGQLGRCYVQLQEPDSVPSNLPDAQFIEALMEARGEAGYLFVSRRRDDLNRDDSVLLTHVVCRHRFITFKAGAVIETELEVVPGAGDNTVLDGASAEGISLVGAGVIDSEQLSVVESEYGESVVSDAEQLAPPGLHVAGWELSVQTGRTHGRVPSQLSCAS